MRTSMSASVFLTLGLIASIGWTLSLAQDLDGSGLELESSASGDESEDDSTSDIIFDRSWPRDVFLASPGLSNNDSPPEERIILENSKSFLEIPEVRLAVIAGCVTGAILATAVASVLIYKWQKSGKEDSVF
ncbi:unnamed protein product [Ophioblennius macclurei]